MNLSHIKLSFLSLAFASMASLVEADGFKCTQGQICWTDVSDYRQKSQWLTFNLPSEEACYNYCVQQLGAAACTRTLWSGGSVKVCARCLTDQVNTNNQEPGLNSFRPFNDCTMSPCEPLQYACPNGAFLPKDPFTCEPIGTCQTCPADYLCSDGSTTITYDITNNCAPSGTCPTCPSDFFCSDGSTTITYDITNNCAPSGTCPDPNSPGTLPTDEPVVDSMIGGDPHIKTWSGAWFDYSGACDLKLIHVPNFHGKGDLDIHARTTGRYLYSYIETAVIRLGNDTLEVSSWGEYSFNKVAGAMINSRAKMALRKANVVSTIGGYPIFHTPTSEKTHHFDIVLSPSSNITISILKDIVSVKVNHATKEDFGNVVGLLGSFQDKMLARDGVTDMSGDVNAFGQVWQVRDDEPMLFQTARAPQYPAKCILPDLIKKEARRLGEGITEEQAKTACAHLKHDEHAFANCVYDVTATNDLDQAYSGAW